MTTPPQGPPPPEQVPSSPSGQPQYGEQPGYGQDQPLSSMPPAPESGYGPPTHAAGQYADMGKRFLARLIDGVILSVPLLILYFILFAVASSDADDGSTGALTGGALIIFYLIAVLGPLAYEVGLIATRGATIGKQIMGVKVVREADGQVPGGGPAFLRWLIPFVGSFVCGIGTLIVYLSPFFDNSGKRQGWHDKVAKTVVISTK